MATSHGVASWTAGLYDDPSDCEDKVKRVAPYGLQITEFQPACRSECAGEEATGGYALESGFDCCWEFTILVFLNFPPVGALLIGDETNCVQGVVGLSRYACS